MTEYPAYDAGVADERERIRQLALRKRAVYCRPCDGAPCDYADELILFADLLEASRAPR